MRGFFGLLIPVGGVILFLYEGRTVYFNGDKVIVLEKVNAKIVKVAKKSNPRMIFFAKRKELFPVWTVALDDWLFEHL